MERNPLGPLLATISTSTPAPKKRHLPLVAGRKPTGGIDQRAAGRPFCGRYDDSPEPSEVIYTGTQDDPFRSANRGNSWELLDCPKTGAPPGTFMFRPVDPSLMYLGTALEEIYRSTNATAFLRLRNTISRAAWPPVPQHNGPVRRRCGSCRCRAHRPITQSGRGQQRLTPHECAAFRLRLRGEVRLRFGQDPVTSSSDHCSGILADLVGQILGC